MKDKLYRLEYKILVWYAKNVMKIPFIVEYIPPPGDRTFGITFTWSPEYRDFVRHSIVNARTVSRLSQSLEAANQTIERMTKGTRARRRELNRASKKAVDQALENQKNG